VEVGEISVVVHTSIGAIVPATLTGPERGSDNFSWFSFAPGPPKGGLFCLEEFMTCYHPITLKKGPNYARGTGQIVNCGRCIGCRLEYARQWAVRILHESSLYENNSFLTLTYRESCLTYGKERPTLVPSDLSNFWKRLRKKLSVQGRDLNEQPIRYFACGEYGDKRNRPHYHACLFGLYPHDAKLYSVKNGNRVYSSDFLDSVWKLGDVRFGDVTFESASYVARYIMKKHVGKDSGYYEDEGIEPEFTRMSLRPGIGADWFSKYASSVFPNDRVISRGHQAPPPRYYLQLLEKWDPIYAEAIKAQRQGASKQRDTFLTAKRLAVKERVKKSRVKDLTRELE